MSVNAPEAGTLKEFLVQEEDTVTVGQDLLKLETGGAAKGIKKTGGQAPKSPAAEAQPISSDPEPPKDNDNSSQSEKSENSQPAPPPPSQAQKKTSSSEVDPHGRSNTNAKGPTTSDIKSSAIDIHHGSREERRVFSY